MEYEMKKINETTGYVIRYITYQIENYDGDEKKLEEFVKELNEDSLFNITYRIKNKEKGIIEETIDTLD